MISALLGSCQSQEGKQQHSALDKSRKYEATTIITHEIWTKARKWHQDFEEHIVKGFSFAECC